MRGSGGDRCHHTLRAVDAAEQALRRRQQDHDEQREDGDRREDAADQEIRRLLEQAERQSADDGAAVIAEPAERHRDKAVEVQQRAIGEERQQQLAAGKSGDAADHAGQRVAGDAQIAFGQAERARGEIVLRDRDEGAADQGAAIEIFERDDGDRAGYDRQPEFFVPDTAADAEQARKRLRLGAPFDRRDLLDHQRHRERRKHVEVLVEAFQHRPHRNEFGDDADDGAAEQRQQEADEDRHAQLQREHRTEHAAQHRKLARGEAHHPRCREHGVVGDADERVDRARRQSGCEDRGEHVLPPSSVAHVYPGASANVPFLAVEASDITISSVG